MAVAVLSYIVFVGVESPNGGASSSEPRPDTVRADSLLHPPHDASVSPDVSSDIDASGEQDGLPNTPTPSRREEIPIEDAGTARLESSEDDSTRPPEDAEKSPERIYELVSDSIVLIEAVDSNTGQISQGSGFIVAPDKIVTNYHVVRDADRVDVKFKGGSTSRIVGFANLYPAHDIAVLAVTPIDSHSPLELSKDVPRIGSKCYALGNPKGLTHTLSDGLVSSLRVAGDSLTWIQTSAPISPGSSGGPLLDSKGRVIGITTSQVSDAQNLNFAVAIDDGVAQSILDSGGEILPINRHPHYWVRQAIRLGYNNWRFVAQIEVQIGDLNAAQTFLVKAEADRQKFLSQAESGGNTDWLSKDKYHQMYYQKLARHHVNTGNLVEAKNADSKSNPLLSVRYDIAYLELCNNFDAGDRVFDDFLARLGKSGISTVAKLAARDDRFDVLQLLFAWARAQNSGLEISALKGCIAGLAERPSPEISSFVLDTAEHLGSNFVDNVPANMLAILAARAQQLQRNEQSKMYGRLAREKFGALERGSEELAINLMFAAEATQQLDRNATIAYLSRAKDIVSDRIEKLPRRQDVWLLGRSIQVEKRIGDNDGIAKSKDMLAKIASRMDHPGEDYVVTQLFKCFALTRDMSSINRLRNSYTAALEKYSSQLRPGAVKYIQDSTFEHAARASIRCGAWDEVLIWLPSLDRKESRARVSIAIAEGLLEEGH